MNYNAIKYIYEKVLFGSKIKWYGNDKYKLIIYCDGRYIDSYKNGKKSWEAEYQNGILHGKVIYWSKDGKKEREVEYQNGIKQ